MLELAGLHNLQAAEQRIESFFDFCVVTTETEPCGITPATDERQPRRKEQADENPAGAVTPENNAGGNQKPAHARCADPEHKKDEPLAAVLFFAERQIPDAVQQDTREDQRGAKAVVLYPILHVRAQLCAGGRRQSTAKRTTNAQPQERCDIRVRQRPIGTAQPAPQV